ncbi:MAG: RDD family protein [Elusimicrobia bacterium]|nr:RDD family protein [Elusimicrobiota bacterium]
MNAPEAEQELDFAFFSERVLAFGVDLALAVVGYLLTLKVVFPRYSVSLNPHAYAWTWLWAAVFIAYQAYTNAEGRRSWGKALVGIHVADLQGQPLTLGRSALRSVCYILSCVFYLGFLWPLFNRRLQGWHDLIARTVVMQDESRAGRPLVAAAAWAIVAVIAAHSVWTYVLSGPYYRVRTVANAYKGLENVASLEREYKAAHGKYTDNLFVLADLSGAPNTFMDSMGLIFETRLGFHIEPHGNGVRISGFARDTKHTPVQIDLE